MCRRALSMLFAGLALCLGLGLLSAGCAASGPPTPVEPGTPEHPLAESTLSYLTECAEHWADDLKERSYKVKFDVTVNDRGGVSDVDPKGSRLDVPDLERCIIWALHNMSVPPFVYERVSSERVAQRIPAHARSLVGNTATMGQVIVTLAPVVIEAGPVVIVVFIAIVVVAAVAAAVSNEMSKECEEEWAYAFKECNKLLSSPNPPRGLTGGYLNPYDCARGLVSKDCKGNEVDHGNQGRPGRKY